MTGRQAAVGPARAYGPQEPTATFTGVCQATCSTWPPLNCPLNKLTVKSYYNQSWHRLKIQPFLLILLHFTVTYALEVI